MMTVLGKEMKLAKAAAAQKGEEWDGELAESSLGKTNSLGLLLIIRTIQK